MVKQLAYLKPKIVWNGKRYIVIRRKNGSKRVIGKAVEFQQAIKIAVNVFHSRIIGRALRYERMRKLGVKEAQ